MKRGKEESIYKNEKALCEPFAQGVLYGDCIRWSLEKPYGYAGDFKIIDDIYRKCSQDGGFAVCTTIISKCLHSVAVRNRKEDFKKLVLENIRPKRDRM